MNCSEVVDLLNDIESRYPVTRWKVDGVHIWPMLRVHLYQVIVHHYLVLADEHPSSTRTRLRRLVAAPKATLRVAGAALTDFRRTRLRPRPADIVVLSDGVSFSKIEDSWYDRVMD